MASRILLHPQRRVRRSLLLLRLCIALLLGGTGLVQWPVQQIAEDDRSASNFGRLVPHHGPWTPSSSSSSSSSREKKIWWSDEQAAQNGVLVQEKRQRYRNSTCRDSSVHRIDDWFVPPPSSISTMPESYFATRTPHKPCRRAFLDLGANVGDSLGKFIDAGGGMGSASCTAATYNVTDGYMYSGGRLSSAQPRSKPLTQWMAARMRDYARTHQSRRGGRTLVEDEEDTAQPEHYCYFGVEGNPVFTPRFAKLQQRILATKPRPVRSIYFYTETVVTGAGDGPTTFYLDTVNARNNFFGSSLLASHTDVRRSAAQDGRAAIARTVTGITLSTLLRQVVRFQAGAHLIVKMDVEGAEYAALNEAWDSGALCDGVASGVRVDIRVEIHPKKTIGDNADLDRFKNQVWGLLKECGVNVEVASDAG